MESQKLKHVEENLTTILLILCENQNFLRYIKYLDDDPLSLIKPDIGVGDVFGNNLNITPFDDEVTVEDEVKVFINPLQGNLDRYPVAEDVYSIDIIVPIANWLLSGKIRPFRIANEICKTIDGQYITGIYRTEITYFKVSKVNSTLSCLTLFLKINNVTIKS